MSVPPSSVSVIIPNWNGAVHLKVCFDSLERQSLRPFETIIVDNGSTDESVAFVQNHYPWAQIIQLDENRGFAAAVNRGILAARGLFIALLNNDTEVSPQWLEKMVEAISIDSSVGSIACKMLRFHDRSIIDAAGDALTRAGAPFTRGAGENDEGQYDKQEFVFGACAGAALYRREIFERIGTFDEHFVSYYEDVDLAMRLQMTGFRCQYEPSAICYHKRGATSGVTSSYPYRMGERNLTAIYIKDFPIGVLITKLPIIVASRIRRVYRSIRAGRGLATMRGILEGLLLLPPMIAKRGAVQRSRVVPISYLRSLMKGNG